MGDFDFYLLLERIEIQNANAVSSPLTHGFPAMSGFLGALHALQRKIPFDVNLTFGGALIACHDYRVKRYRPNPYSEYTLNQSRNPIKRNGNTASIIEEGKIDLTVSLVIPVYCDDYDDEEWLSSNKETFVEWMKSAVQRQRMAGGSVFNLKAVELEGYESLDDLKARLTPAFILTDARQDLIDITRELQQDNPDATALDALLDVATLHHIPEQTEKGWEWTVKNAKQGRGWLVPMPVGYQSISPLFDAGTMVDCRTRQYPSQFVERLYSLGKWVFPYSLAHLEQAFWQMNASNNGLYLIEPISE